MQHTPTHPSPSIRPTHQRSTRGASPQIVRPILGALGVFVLLAGIGLGVALVSGATLLFNILVWAVFTVLWLAGAVAMAVSPRTLDDLWQAVRRLPLVLQAGAWLLFLPLLLGLWIWTRSWSMPLRVVLVLALGVWTVYVLFPHG